MGKSRQAVARQGQHHVYLEFLEEVVGVLKKYNKSAMFWYEMLCDI